MSTYGALTSTDAKIQLVMSTYGALTSTDAKIQLIMSTRTALTYIDTDRFQDQTNYVNLQRHPGHR
jgi:hypothetical protein